ncbi:MAG: hypothetical protein JXE07_06250 [Candidatus Aminicenantes bacterium]|nr:hypothetical protein [Candidatus Aminicenantes bacterium]
MSLLFSRRTSGSFSGERIIKRKGSILIVTMFLFLAFGGLALGLIIISQVYLKIGGYEKHSGLLGYGSENGIKEGFHHLSLAATSAPLPAVLTEERYAELRNDALSAGNLLAEEAMGLRFPIQRQAQEERMIWQSRTGCQSQNILDQDGFVLARFVLPIQSEGRLTNLTFSRSSSLDVKVEVLAGHVPLSTIPFLLDSDLPPEEQDDFQEENGITFLPYPGAILPPRVSFADASLIPQDATPLLEKALDIEIFRPQDISTAQLRSVLGLEESQEPVPEGVYLIRNDMGLGGVYVQGDVEEIVAAIEGSCQVLSFRMESGLWILKFSPSESRTVFSSPEGEEVFDLVPLGIIIVDGEVRSFGGGYIDGGEVRLLQDQEVPSLLAGINLTLVASGEITITSHLLQQGISWQEGIPYVKSDQTQLVIFSTGRELWGEDVRQGGIVISQSAPQDLKVQAGLTAGGGGLRLEGEDAALQLLGSIQTTDYAFAGRRLNLIPWLPQVADDRRPVVGPRTSQPVLFIFRFSIAAWREF